MRLLLKPGFPLQFSVALLIVNENRKREIRKGPKSVGRAVVICTLLKLQGRLYARRVE